MIWLIAAGVLLFVLLAVGTYRTERRQPASWLYRGPIRRHPKPYTWEDN